jgi:hypothetical protein
MPEFIAKYAEKMREVISGFDRLIFRGSLRAIRYAQGMKAYLVSRFLLLVDLPKRVGYGRGLWRPPRAKAAPSPAAASRRDHLRQR